MFALRVLLCAGLFTLHFDCHFCDPIKRKQNRRTRAAAFIFEKGTELVTIESIINHLIYSFYHTTVGVASLP